MSAVRLMHQTKWACPGFSVGSVLAKHSWAQVLGRGGLAGAEWGQGWRSVRDVLHVCTQIPELTDVHSLRFEIHVFSFL